MNAYFHLLFSLLAAEVLSGPSNGKATASTSNLRRGLLSCAAEGEDCGVGYRDHCSGSCDWSDFNTERCVSAALEVGNLIIKASEGGTAHCVATSGNSDLPRSGWQARLRKCTQNGLSELDISDGRIKTPDGSLCLTSEGLNQIPKFRPCGYNTNREKFVYDSKEQTFYNAYDKGYLTSNNVADKDRMYLKTRQATNTKQQYYLF